MKKQQNLTSSNDRLGRIKENYLSLSAFSEKATRIIPRGSIKKGNFKSNNGGKNIEEKLAHLRSLTLEKNISTTTTINSNNHQIPGWHSRYFENVCENLSKLSKTKFIVLRPSEVFGEHDNFKSNFSRNIPLFLNNLINKKKVIFDKTYYIKKIIYMLVVLLILF